MENKTHLKTVSGYQLDEIDNQILELLIENTRMPYTEIAKKLIISAGTVHVRVRKMEEAGIITGSTLNIDYSKMGFSGSCFFCHSWPQRSIASSSSSKGEGFPSGSTR